LKNIVGYITRWKTNCC